MSSVDDYLEGLPEPQREAFERVRGLVNRVAPGVDERTSYGMPAFTYRDRPLLGIRAAKSHLSVFPFSPAAIDAARDALAGLDLSKGTVRFTPEAPIPDEALETLLRCRMREIDDA